MCTFLVASCPWQHKYNFRQFCVCVPIQAGNVSWFLCVSMTSFHAVLLCYLFKNFHNDHLNEILWNLFGKCSSKRRFFCFGGWDAVLSKHPSNKKRLNLNWAALVVLGVIVFICLNGCLWITTRWDHPHLGLQLHCSDGLRIAGGLQTQPGVDAWPPVGGWLSA